MELACVNHWPVAIETHSRNHPDARHYCMDLEAAKPEEIVPEGRLDLLMASPTCTYHSRARGGRPTSDQQRMDPWHVVRWVTTLRVKRLMVENVPEFVDWGPIDLRTGRPIKSRRGEYFRAWLDALRAIGFRLDWRILNCADYGDATTRQRFILIGRTDGRRLRWPDPTHAPADKAQLLGLKPWRPAREIIDWAVDSQSIFERKKPLADNTLIRIAAGLKKFGGPLAGPFLVVLRNHCDALSIDEPLPTVCAGGTHIGLAEPVIEPFVLGQQSGSAPRDTGRPLPTIATGGALQLVEPSLEPFMVQIDHTGRGNNPRSVDAPIPTIVTKQNAALVKPFLTPYYGTSGPASVTDPLNTVTTKARFGLVQPFVVPQFGERPGQAPRTHDIEAPLPTVTGHDAGALVEPVAAPAADQVDGDVPLDRLVNIGGRPYLLDIRFRMLRNHELARASGFSDDESEYEFAGNVAEVTKQIGNAVPVNTSTAIVAALFGDRA
jgi:DNA (cytosine-5)-methyltransferase 1